MNTCPACRLYDHSRGPLIRAEIAKTTAPADREARWLGFLAGVHDRHRVAVQGQAVRRGLGRFAALMALANEDVEESAHG